jgi:hypothetical protein
MNRNSLQVCTALIFMSFAGFASATQSVSKAAVVFPIEGNATCNTFAKNKIIKEMRAQPAAPSGTVSNGIHSASYAGGGSTTASFSGSTISIDFAILKSGGYGSLFIYPSGGVLEDAGMQLMASKNSAQAPTAQPIEAITLCYGLGNEMPPQVSIPNCKDIDLDGLVIQCPDPSMDSPKRSIIFNFELDGQQFYNTANSALACVCNSEPLPLCDPNVPYLEVDGVPVENNACPKPAASKSGVEVTTHIELNNDPYVCSTIGGKRTCYYY